MLTGRRFLIAVGGALLGISGAASAATVFTENFETTSKGGPGRTLALSSSGSPNEYRFAELNNGGLADPTRNYTVPGWTVETAATINANGLGSKVYVQRDNDGGTTANTFGNGALAGMPNDASGDLWLLLDRRGANPTSGVGNGAYRNAGTIAVNTVYTLTGLVGVRSDLIAPAAYEFGLWAGAGSTPSTAAAIKTQADVTVVAADASPPGNSESFSIVLDTSLPANAGLIGQNLFVRFFIPGSAGNLTAAAQVGFDNLTLDGTPVPEPAGAALFGASMLTLGLRRRRSCA